MEKNETRLVDEVANETLPPIGGNSGEDTIQLEMQAVSRLERRWNLKDFRLSLGRIVCQKSSQFRRYHEQINQKRNQQFCRCSKKKASDVTSAVRPGGNLIALSYVWVAVASQRKSFSMASHSSPPLTSRNIYV